VPLRLAQRGAEASKLTASSGHTPQLLRYTIALPALQAGDDAPDVEVKRTPAQTARLLFSTLCCTMYCLGG
jgi:alkylhydroperoxidase family enzyme